MEKAKSFLTVKQTSEKYPAFTERALRWLILDKERNGFKAVVRKVGRRVLIDEAAFLSWIESGAHGSAAA